MKYFRKDADMHSDIIKITRENFEAVTGNKYPYEQAGAGGASQYAYCPACLNPVRIIGIMEKKKVPPYARHAGGDVPGMSQWDLIKYEYCPYASRRRRDPIDDDELLEVTDNAVAMHGLLREYFDYVVILLSNTLNIRASGKLWEDALRQFIASHGYCYPMLNDINLPYIFAYRGMQHKNIWSASFKAGTDLCDTIEGYPNVLLTDAAASGYKRLAPSGTFIDLRFRFTSHKTRIENDELRESIRFCIDDFMNNETVFEQTIVFSETTFQDMRRRAPGRQQWLLDIADRNMPPI